MTRLPALALLPLAALALATAAWFAIDEIPLRFDAVLVRRDALRETAASAPVLTLGLFLLVYFLIISSALPVGPPMSLIAGFLFGRWLGTGAILTAATAGALVVFSLARLFSRAPLGERLRARAGPAYDAIGRELRRDAFGYLVVMRLAPIFPFFAVNIVAGLFGVPARTFALATVLGRMPAAFLYVSLGQELGRVSSIEELASGRVLLILSGMAALAAASLAIARLRRRSGGDRRREHCASEAHSPVSPAEDAPPAPGRTSRPEEPR